MTHEQRVEETAYEDALSLANALWRRHYYHVSQWRPLDTTVGIISQIDNMTAGLGEKLDAATAALASSEKLIVELRETLAEIELNCVLMGPGWVRVACRAALNEDKPHE